MQDMTPAEITAFLMDTMRTGKVATVRADGRPHLAPIWYIYEEGKLYFNTWHESVKGQNITRDGRISICVDEEQPPFAFVIIEGSAEVVPVTPAERLTWSTRLARRYMGDDLAEQYGQRNGVEGELLICVTPDKIIAKKNVSN
ncbi:MAG: PPOX class F420-dependent oxidoreductase [Anaerolineae bacterium]